MLKRILKVVLWVLLAAALLFGGLAAWNWEMIQRTALGGLKVYETTPPAMPTEIARPAILVFSKTNGFRHEGAIPVANTLFGKMAADNGWGYFQTENGAAFSPKILSRFDAVVFNNVSGDVFTPEQRAAFENFVESGGGFVGIHGAGGDPQYDWKWYVDELIGAQFIGHPVFPQFQPATIHVENRSHPATTEVPWTWKRTDEWYSFDRSVRGRPGYSILATLNEESYSNKSMFGRDLAMGQDHPIIWWHCQGKGRALYSALGHSPEAYREPEYRKLLTGATKWALGLTGTGCNDGPARTGSGQTG